MGEWTQTARHVNVLPATSVRRQSTHEGHALVKRHTLSSQRKFASDRINFLLECFVEMRMCFSVNKLFLFFYFTIILYLLLQLSFFVQIIIDTYPAAFGEFVVLMNMKP